MALYSQCNFKFFLFKKPKKVLLKATHHRHAFNILIPFNSCVRGILL